MARPDPGRVNPVRARRALRLANGDQKHAWSRYIQLTFQEAGALAPGCDARDLLAWFAAQPALEVVVLRRRLRVAARGGKGAG